MEFPSIKILSPKLELRSEIDLYTSLQYTRSWQGVGSFEIHMVGNPAAVENGNIIMIGGDGHRAGIIRCITQNVSVNGVETVVTGQTLDGFTVQRVVLPSENAADCGYFAVPAAESVDRTVPAETILKTYAAACLSSSMDTKRNMPIKIADDNGRGLKFNWLSRYDILNDVLQAVSEYGDCGWEIGIDLSNRQFIFDYVPGVDRTVSQNTNSRVILSREFESVDSITYNINQFNYKNLAYCGGTGDDANRLVLAVSANDTIPEGFERFEIFEDCGTLEAAETDTALSLADEGMHKLNDYKLVQSLTAEISQSGTFVYRKHWDLGDLVTVRDNDIGIQQDLRIAEVTESYEPDSIKLSATLGTAPLRIGRIIKRFNNSTIR